MDDKQAMVRTTVGKPLEQIPREYVIRAIENCRKQGRVAFDASYGKDAPLRYPLVFEGEEFTPKSIFRETVRLYQEDHGDVVEQRQPKGGFKDKNGITRIVGRWGFQIRDNHTGRILNPEDLPADEAVLEDDQDGNEAELLRKALKETKRPPSEIDKEIEDAGPPERITSENTRFRRNMLVRARVLQLADGTCELCEEKASFNTPDGRPYLEVHHVTALSKCGHDQVANMAAICPNCHRKIHFGSNGRSVNDELAGKIAARSRQPLKPEWQQAAAELKSVRLHDEV